MSKTVVILQSNYIPWKGYFDLMNAADEFVIFDEVQFTRRDWRNRNKVIVNGAPKWLTIPVESKGNYNAAVRDMRVPDAQWAAKHWGTLKHSYAKAPFFDTCHEPLREAYDRAAKLEFLSEINLLFLGVLADVVGISTVMTSSDTVPRQAEGPAERLIEICRAREATTYLSGPAARSYIDPQLFADAGIDLAYADYAGYPDYPQTTTTLEHGVSIIDLLMTVGPETRSHLKTRDDPTAIFATQETG